MELVPSPLAWAGGFPLLALFALATSSFEDIIIIDVIGF